MFLPRTALLTALTIVTLVTTLFCTKAASAAGHGKQVWKVPVIYVTDRQVQKENYGPKRVLEKNTVARVDSGIIEMFVKEDVDEASADWHNNAILTKAEAMEAPCTRKFRCQSVPDLKNDFDKTLRQCLERTGKKEAFVFVHGFNNTFEEAASGAARLSLHTGCPVILYSWPSVAKVFKYSIDECNNEWSQEHFNQFIEHLVELKNSDNLKLSIVAHSMGNRLFVRGIPVMVGTGVFKDVYMVNPDFDAETFVHYLARYLPKTGLKQDVRAQLLISRKDHALSLSEALFGGYTRLGQGMDYTLSALTSPELFNKVWGFVSFQQQSPQLEDDSDTSGDAKSDTGSGAKGNTGGDDSELVASLEKSFKIYDVTALDSGFIGHKIPFEFIAWMHNKEQAPPGFEIVNGKSKGLNKLSKFFARNARQNIGDGPLGECSIVVKSTK